MIQINAAIQLEHTSPADALGIIAQSEKTFSRADHVLAVTVLPEPAPEHPEQRSTRWAVLLNGAEMTWVQRENISSSGGIGFEQTEGDLARMWGRWVVAETGPRLTRINLHFCLELGVDGLAPLLEPIWAQSFQVHAHSLLRAVAARANPPGNSRCTTT